MSSIAEQFTSAQRTGLEIFTNIVSGALNNAGELTRLNFQTAEAVAERSVEHFNALAANRSLPAWVTLNRSLAMTTLAASLGHSRRAAEIYGEWWLTPARVLDSLASESTLRVAQQAAGAAPAFDFFAAVTRSMASLASLNPLLSASFSRAGAGDSSQGASQGSGDQGGRSVQKVESAPPTRLHAGKRNPAGS